MLSILLPAFNAQATLESCLRSVARQTFTDWECVVVDDGSSDGTRTIVERFARSDRRFRLVATTHGGLVAALNAGLARCNGEWIARMDADDLMRRRRLARQLQHLECSGVDACGCHVRLFPRRSLREGMRAYERWLNGIRDERDLRREAFIECPLAHPTLIARAALLRELGYRDAGWPEDYDLVLRLLERGARLSVVPERLLAWRADRGSLSRIDPRYSLDRFTACKAAYLASGPLRNRARYGLWGHGPTGRALKRALAAHGREPAFIVDVHPRRQGNTIDGARVLEPDRLQRTGLPLIVSVAGLAARSEIRQFLQRRGWLEPDDFLCAA